MDDKKSKKAVEEIIDDLSGRRGLKWEWEAIDEDVKEEIKETWIKIISEAISK